jgi:membrane protein implicated in regulation of membrane protease activity
MVHVQAILFASLATSLFSAFLAMLGKQWLNRYDSTDKRGSAIERGQNRQQKLDGIVAWYFDL